MAIAEYQELFLKDAQTFVPTPPEIVNRICQVYPLREITETIMATPKRSETLFSENEAKQVAIGEINRFRSMRDYHRFLYQEPLHLLRERGVIEKDYSMRELGPSLGLHLATLRNSLQPAQYIGEDHEPHIVAAAQVAISRLQREGLLSQDANYLINLGGTDNRGLIREKADVSISVLTSMYAGERKTLDWLMKNGQIGVNGDVFFSPVPISETELKEGLLPIRSFRSGIETNLVWRLSDAAPQKTFLGDRYKADLVRHNGIDDYGDRVVYIPVVGDRYDQEIITVSKENGQLYYETWDMKPLSPENENEEHQVLALALTLRELYLHIKKATDGDTVWDSAAVVTLPFLAAQEGYYSGVLATTTPESPLPATLPYALMMRYREELSIVHESKLLSEIGSGKTFEDLSQAFRIMAGFLNPANRINEKYRFDGVPIFASITTRDRKQFNKLKRRI